MLEDQFGDATVDSDTADGFAPTRKIEKTVATRSGIVTATRPPILNPYAVDNVPMRGPPIIAPILNIVYMTPLILPTRLSPTESCAAAVMKITDSPLWNSLTWASFLSFGLPASRSALFRI